MNYAAVIEAPNNLTSMLPLLSSGPSRQDYKEALAKRFDLPVSAFVGN